MDWMPQRRRGSEWKQGWRGQTMASIATPPLHLLAIFGIVMLLLWISHHTDYKAQLHHSSANLSLLLLLSPLLLVTLMALYSSSVSFEELHFRLPWLGHAAASGGGSPWIVALLLVLILVLVSYQSWFRSK